MEWKKSIWDAVRLALAYVLCYLCATAVFIGLFHTCFLKSMDVFMYRGIVFLVVSSGTAAVLMGVFRHFLRKKFISWKDIILLFIGCCCVNMVFFTLVPVTVERSVSVFMLSYMEENTGTTYTKDDVEEIFVKKYVQDYGAFEKRFHEQVVTGTIQEKSDGTYEITHKGKQVVKLFRVIADWFQTDQRLVYPDGTKRE